jgi:hypothetical protein
MIKYADGSGLVVCGPGEVKTLDTKPVGEKWCFVCRKRREFTDQCRVEAGITYYDPWWTRTCSEGHFDGDLFPGYIREWGEQ